MLALRVEYYKSKQGGTMDNKHIETNKTVFEECSTESERIVDNNELLYLKSIVKTFDENTAKTPNEGVVINTPQAWQLVI